jgi:hypothetical protein
MPHCFLILPQPVIGASMVFTASFMIAGGVQIIVSRNIDSRATYVVGVSLLLGLAREIFPAYFKLASPLLHLFTGSMMSIGVMSAFLINLIFRIGATRSATFELRMQRRRRLKSNGSYEGAAGHGRSPRTPLIEPSARPSRLCNTSSIPASSPGRLPSL